MLVRTVNNITVKYKTTGIYTHLPMYTQDWKLTIVHKCYGDTHSLSNEYIGSGHVHCKLIVKYIQLNSKKYICISTSLGYYYSQKVQEEKYHYD